MNLRKTFVQLLKNLIRFALDGFVRIDESCVLKTYFCNQYNFYGYATDGRKLVLTRTKVIHNVTWTTIKSSIPKERYFVNFCREK